MNDYTVIILFVAANPSKDISRARKIILRKKEEPESVDRSFQIHQNQYYFQKMQV
ncbi:hypothetical protein [Microcoleus sp. S13_C3]|uniref:hypothetical protein n=1 Tax=Microcoleus sp. S13_C3 TaxID=3055409 RepID=UPI002FD50AAB